MCMCDCYHWCYLFAALKTLVKGGLQRKVSEEHQGFSSSLSRSPRDTGDGFNKSIHHSSSIISGGGRGNDDDHYKNTPTPPHSPHFLTSTVISVEPAHCRSLSLSSSSSSLQLDHHSTQNSELASPRSPRSRHNSGGSSLSRCGSRGSTAREANRGSMKSIPSRNSGFRRPVGGSLKDFKGHPRGNRGGSSGDPHLTINTGVTPRRSVSLRSPRHGPSARSPHPQPVEGNLLPVGLYIGSENSVRAAYDIGNQKKFSPSPTMSTHSVLSGQWTPLEVGLEWWKRKHKLQLVQHDNIENKEGTGAKIRYNDVGSMEDIRGSDLSDIIFPDSNEETEMSTMEVQPNQIKHQYRALWELRATLEEEDWASAKNPPKMARMPGGPSLSPTIPPKEDTQALLASASYSTEQSPDRDPMSSHTTSFESNTEPTFEGSKGGGGGHMGLKEVFHHLGPTSHASLIARRQSYKNVLHNRMKRERSANIVHETDNGNVTETTTSFDSIETQESTSTDTSRLEAITTSIESTDNTDSATDTHHLHYGTHHAANMIHFRSDSGYKSIENGGGSCNTTQPAASSNQGITNSNPGYGKHGLDGVRLLPRRCLSSGSSVDTSSNLAEGKTSFIASYSGSSFRAVGQGNNDNMLMSGDINHTQDFFAKVGQTPTVLQSFVPFGNNAGTQSSLSSSSCSANTCATTITDASNRNVSRKRRDLGRFERHSIGSLDSFHEPLDEESGSSPCESIHTRGGSVKGSLLYRYFRNPRSSSAYYARDYSIDEKSDQLFREFSRCDPSFDIPPFSSTRQSPKLYSRRHSSARGTASLDFSGTGRILPSSHQTSPVSMSYCSITSQGTKILIRKGSDSQHYQPQLAGRFDQDDENQLMGEARGLLLPNVRFQGAGGHTSIPIITVDDS